MAISLHLELKTGSQSFTPRHEVVEQLDQNTLSSLSEKYKDEGTIHSWTAKEQLPYDEGYKAASEGVDDDQNPYSQSFWQHDEWRLGWDAYNESNSIAE